MIKKIIMITVLVLLSACGGRNEYIVETIPDRKIEATERPRNLNRSNASALLAKSRACDRLQPRRER